MASYERLQSGLYRGIYYVRGVKHRTKAPHHEKARDALNAAEDAAAKARREASSAQGTLQPSIEYGDWWPLWWEKRPVEESTKKIELNILQNHVLPQWQSKPLNEIEHPDVVDWRDHLLRVHSRNYACKIYYLFQGSMTFAVKSPKGPLTASPCAGVSVTHSKRPAGRRIEVEEFDALVADLRVEDYRDAAITLADTGMRPGELAGLHSYSAPTRSGWLEIQDALASGMDYIRSSPKDEEPRSVPTTSRVGEILSRRKGRAPRNSCGLRHTEGVRCRGDLLFRRPNGKPFSLDNFQQALERACARLKIPLITPYDLRRFYASQLADAGVDAFEIARLMGHSTLTQAMEYVRRTAAARAKVLVALGDPRAKQLTIVQGHLGQPGTEPGTQPDFQAPSSAAIGSV
ncbi:MAG TPA: tyrosine-type recombinase/integrase [Pseudonocardiaceae bacterium]|nr:tyrosine-type recombinase/integrase [Pseudonocardiaceae bacterium]